MTAVAPPAENDPTWHSPDTTDSPSCAQYLPGSQAVQEDVLAPEAEYDPAGHHPEMAVKPVPAQYFPGSQGVQPLEPAAFWYVPEGQDAHDGKPPGLYVPAAQDVHVEDDVPPEVWLYVPAGQD